MSDRETSFAKSVELDSYQQSLLDRVERLKGRFDGHASNRQEQKSGEKQGSAMVEGDSSTAKNRPPEHMAKEVNRDIHNERKNNDDKTARQKELLKQQERLKNNQEASKNSNSNKGGYSNDI